MKKAYWTLLGALLLIGAALYNGFPLVTSDSGAYIDSGFLGWVPADRPILYGLFVRHSSLAVSLWFTIITQSLLLSYLLWQIMSQYINETTGRTAIFFIFIILILFSSIGWYSSQIMPDVFTSMGVLAMCLLLLSKQSLSNKILTAILFLFSCMVHNSNLLIFSMLIVLLIPLGMLLKAFKNKSILKKNYFIVLFLIVSSWFLSATLNYFMADQFKLSGTPHAFLVAKNIENGMVDKYLDEKCKDNLITEIPDSSLCFISAKHSEKMIDVSRESKLDGGVVHQWEFTGAENQQFYIIKVEKEKYKIVSKNSNKCLEVFKKDSLGGTQLIQKTFSGKPNQLFKFQKVGVQDEWHIINIETLKRLAIEKINSDNGAQINTEDSTITDNQRFRIVKVPYCMCLYKEKLPSSAIAFLWNNNSVFGKTGAWSKSNVEYDRMLHEIYFSGNYIGSSIGEAIIATLRQIISNEIGDGIGGYDKNSAPHVAIEKHLKYELKPFENSKQSGYIDFEGINNRHFWLLLFSISTIIVFFAVDSLKSSVSQSMMVFIYICITAIICNAFVTGAMANVLNRLQARIVWLVPLIALLLLFNYLAPKIKNKVSQ